MPPTVQASTYRGIVNGTAITGLVFAASVSLPVIGLLCALLIPLPVLFYRSKLGRNAGVMVPVLTIVAMAILFDGALVGIAPLFALLLLGFVLSELIEAGLSVERVILYATGTVLLAGTVALIFYGAASDRDVIRIISAIVTRNLELLLKLYEDVGVSEENLQLISAVLDLVHYWLLRMLPAAIVSLTLFAAWVNLLLAKPLLKNRTLFWPDYGALNTWKAPDSLVWGSIGCGLVILITKGPLMIIALNGLVILMTVYFFQGIAIMAFYFEKKRFPRVLRVFIYSLIFVQQMMVLVVIALGFFDLWLNFRRLGKEENS